MAFTAASSSFLDRASKLLCSHRTFSKLVVAFAVGGGGLVAYADSGSDGAARGGPSRTPPKKRKIVILGTGWAGISFLKDLDTSLYDVQIVSPRNYFTFTPLLPSVTCGTVDARSIVEPIRKIMKKKVGEIRFWEAECFKIDPENKMLHCRPTVGGKPALNKEFVLGYDSLVIAIGAQVNTCNVPGVLEHCHFLKEVEDAQRIRMSVLDCFERASLPNLTEEERKENLHFVIIGGGPTGIEFAAELHDFVTEDIMKLYPRVQDDLKISIIQAGEHILTTFDKRISAFAEEKFRRDGINLMTGFRVTNVSDKTVTVKHKTSGETFVPYGMAVWSAGIGTRPVILDLMKQIGQANRRVLATDEWLRVHGCLDVYALGDCATISQRKIMDDISDIFKIADKDNSGTLTIKEIKDVLGDICESYPQVELYLKSNHMEDIVDLLNDTKGDYHIESLELNIEEFKLALAEVDSQMKSHPATAQVAAQQGAYLARCFNHMEEAKENPEGPIRFKESGRHRFHPFQYKHFGQFAPLGGEQAAAELPGDWISIGYGSQWLWYSVYARYMLLDYMLRNRVLYLSRLEHVNYANDILDCMVHSPLYFSSLYSKQVSWRTRVAVVSDWTRRYIFGRDSSRI